MKAKCIRLFTLNLHVFYFFLLCIQKGLTITTDHGNVAHHRLFRHERHYQPSGYRSNQEKSAHHTSTTAGVNEAVHAFHPSNNLHLLHSLKFNSRYMKTVVTTTTPKPYTTRKIRQNSFQSPSKLGGTSNSYYKLYNHLHKPPFLTTTIVSMSPATTVAPESVHRNSLIDDERIHKSKKMENFFLPTSKHGTTMRPQSILSKSSAYGTVRPVYSGMREPEDYISEFNGKNYRSDTFAVKHYGEIIPDDNLGKDINLKDVGNDDDDDDEDTEEDDEEYDVSILKLFFSTIRN